MAGTHSAFNSPQVREHARARTAAIHTARAMAERIYQMGKRYQTRQKRSAVSKVPSARTRAGWLRNTRHAFTDQLRTAE